MSCSLNWTSKSKVMSSHLSLQLLLISTQHISLINFQITEVVDMIYVINIVKNHLQLQSSSYRYRYIHDNWGAGRISNIIRVDMSNTEETRNPISEHTASTTLLESQPEKPDYSKWGWGRNKCNDLLIKGECSCFPSNKVGCICYLCGKLIVPDDCINDLSAYTHTSCVNKQ